MPREVCAERSDADGFSSRPRSRDPICGTVDSDKVERQMSGFALESLAKREETHRFRSVILVLSSRGLSSTLWTAWHKPMIVLKATRLHHAPLQRLLWVGSKTNDERTSIRSKTNPASSTHGRVELLLYPYVVERQLGRAKHLNESPDGGKALADARQLWRERGKRRISSR